VKFVPLSAKDRFTALQSGENRRFIAKLDLDTVADTSLGLNYTGVTYYDGQGFLVPQVTQGQFRTGIEQRLDLRAEPGRPTSRISPTTSRA